jgi:ABC-type ATPase with predicted acetyltransferase domain
MALMKCSECGQIFDGNLKECPNCACPASECENVAEADNATRHIRIYKIVRFIDYLLTLIFDMRCCHHYQPYAEVC